jgi:DNA modification methylase
MGSGTVAKACILTHRKYIGFEISEEYCKIAKERLNNISYEMRGFRVKSGEETNIKNQKKLF